MTEKTLIMPVSTTGYTSFYFLHAVPDGAGKLKKTGGGSHTCREFFSLAMRKKYTQGENREIFTGRTYVVVTYGPVQPGKLEEKRCEKLQRDLTKSLKYINCLEREYGWPLTKMFPVENVDDGPPTPAMLFLGSGRWNTSVYMLSLYTLLIRGCSRSWVPGPGKADDWSVLEQKLFDKSVGGRLDASKIHRTVRYWRILVKYHSRMWAGHPKKWHWQLGRLTDSTWERLEGIHMLCTGTTKCAYALGKLNALKKEEKLK